MKKFLWIISLLVIPALMFVACGDTNSNQEAEISDAPLSEDEEAEATAMLDTLDYDSTAIDTLDIDDEEEEDQ